jgi:hypothetical protein
VRIALRNGVPSDAVTELGRKVYVDVAADEFRLGGRRQTLSRISVITGLNRKEVSRLMKLIEASEDNMEVQRNRAAHVLSAWLRDPDFHDRKGDPLDLPFTGELSFAELVKRHSGDMKPRAIADELLAADALETIDGKLRMTARGYVPGHDPEELLRILGIDPAELIGTIDHNLTASEGERLYQRKVKYDNVPAEHRDEFLRLSARKAQLLLEELDRWLAARDRGRRRSKKKQPVSIGLGTYHILEPSPYDDSGDDK